MNGALGEFAPKYARLAEQLREQIRAGELRPGDPLPSFAQMRRSDGVSQDTLTKAHDLLEKEGLIVRERGRGVFVASPAVMAPLRRVLGVLGYAQTEHPYWTELFNGLHEAATAAGYSLLLGPFQAEDRDECAGFLLLNGNTGGVAGVSRPTVSVFKQVPGVPCVHWDDEQCVDVLMDHLLELGHRNIAYLCLHSAHGRVQGWQRALERAGITPDHGWSRPLAPGAFQHELGFQGHGYLSMRQWLQEGFLDHDFTALMVYNDDAAMGAMRALREAGVGVPFPLSLAGFDGLDWIAHFHPSLTSLHLPLRAMGRAAVNQLVESIETGSSRQLPPFRGELRRGESTVAVGTASLTLAGGGS